MPFGIVRVDLTRCGMVGWSAVNDNNGNLQRSDDAPAGYDDVIPDGRDNGIRFLLEFGACARMLLVCCSVFDIMSVERGLCGIARIISAFVACP